MRDLLRSTRTFIPAALAACAIAAGCGMNSRAAADQDAGAPANPPTAAVCSTVGTVCGADGVTNGDADSVYVCTAVGAQPVSSMKCMDGCAAGQCTSTGADAGIDAGPGAGAGDCPSGGLYCGGDQISGDPGTLYTCPGAGLAPAVQQVCASGCQVNPAGTDDACANAIAQTCPGAGDYCGGDGVSGGAANTLYHCPGAGTAPSSAQACSSSCMAMPAGTNDVCIGACPTAGDYCGDDGLNGPAGVLFHCDAAGRAPASSTTCSSSCTHEPAGTNDVCGGTCGTYGQAALSWEAGQLDSGDSWSDYCLGFVNTAYQVAGAYESWLGAATAADSLAEAEGVAGFTWWNGSCPCGAILYWSANACNAYDGHIVICNGDGTVSTSGWPGYGGSTSASISWLSGEECGNAPAGYIRP